MDPISITLLFGVLLGLIVITTIVDKNRHSSQHRLFVVFIVLLILDQLFTLARYTGWMEPSLALSNLNLPNSLLFGPLLYLYGREILQQRKTYFKQTFWHFLPFLVLFTFVLATSLVSVPSGFFVSGRSLVGFLVVHMSVYSALGINNAIRCASVKSDNAESSKIRWVLFLNVALFMAAILWVASSGVIIDNRLIFSNIIPSYSIDLFSVLVTYLIVIYLVRTPAFLQATTASPATRESAKYEKSTLSPDLQQQKLDRILHTIESNKLYLARDYSLNLVAEYTGMTRHHVSQIINMQLECTFLQLTHRYRINEAKRKLLEHGHGLKIEQLAYELGYKSKSSFFKAFKRATQLTPQGFVQSQGS